MRGKLFLGAGTGHVEAIERYDVPAVGSLLRTDDGMLWRVTHVVEHWLGGEADVYCVLASPDVRLELAAFEETN